MTPALIAGMKARRSRSGMTLLEVAVASIVMVIIALGGASYYYFVRWGQIRKSQEQMARNLAEVELERWRETGYTALQGYTTPAVIPYGYVFGTNTQAYPKDVTVDGLTYRITASMLYNTSTSGSNYRWEDTTGGVTYRYRRLVITVGYGSSYTTTTSMEGRIGE